MFQVAYLEENCLVVKFGFEVGKERPRHDDAVRGENP